MKRLMICALLVASASAFLTQRPQPQQQPSNNSQRMPDMNLVMQLVRQILMLLLPKLLANPSLLSAMTGAPAATQQPAPQPPPVAPQPVAPPPRPPMPPQQPPPVQPPYQPQPPPPMSGPGGMGPGGMGPGGMGPGGMGPGGMGPGGMGPGGMGPGGMGPGGMGPGGAGPGGMGPGMGGGGYYPGPPMGPGGFVSPLGDKFKDMRIVELLQDPQLPFLNDPYVSAYIPRRPVPLGSSFSLPDMAKEHVTYTLHRKRMSGHMLTRKEGELYRLLL